ncbi:MAG: hypothetical protein ACK5ZV_15235, partial [bacterium]
MVYRKQMEANLHCCPECQHHFRIGAAERVRQLTDPNTFEPMFTGLRSTDPLKFKDLKPYADRLKAEAAKGEAHLRAAPSAAEPVRAGWAIS